ncbi:hypothetical protein C8F01DRAFT_1227660 [Mycena amicta]|nr:hypothetical protein C8F01DRAFT_1227660 [Mycena amicta]
MKSTFVLFVSLAMAIAAVSGLAVVDQPVRHPTLDPFNIYPTLAPQVVELLASRNTEAGFSEATPGLEERIVQPVRHPTLDPFNIYPTLAPEATPGLEERKDKRFNLAM